MSNTDTTVEADAPLQLAVSYLRVSTREQAERGGTDEGFSIPAQREANQRKATELGARVVREFIDAGESARSADRDGLQEMLAFIAATRVQFCLVHKLDRLARNRVDDVKIHEALLAAGVTLVSATESIDQTPSGMLVHGIMSSIAEFYSRNLATEVTKGLTQKLAQGGTPMRAPIGYFNVRRTDAQGREVRTVEIDPERAPLIRWAFETYAKCETSVTGLLRDLTMRGLVTVPSPKRPSKPLGKNTLYKLLTNPYYAGVIRYKGALHPGAHEPLIEPALFDQVQALLKARNARMTRHVTHAHHQHLAAEVDAAFDEQSAGRDQEFADLTTNRARLEAESDKLLAAHFADAIDLPTLKRHQDRIRTGLADIEQRLAQHDEHHVGARAFLHDCLRLLTEAHHAYARSDDGNRRLANQAFYDRLEITDDEQLRPRLAEPFATIVTQASTATAGKEAKREHSTSTDVACSRKTLWVVLRGCFSNPRKALTSLILRSHKDTKLRGARRRATQRADVRGPVVGKPRQTQTRLNASNRAALLAAYARGEPVQALADRFGIHRGTVRQLARRANLPRHRPRLPENTRRQAARLYEGGLTLPQVAARLGISIDGARAGIIASGGTIRPRGRRPARA